MTDREGLTSTVLVADDDPGVLDQPIFHLPDGDTTHPVCGRDGSEMRQVQQDTIPFHRPCPRCKRYAGEVL